MVSQEWFYRDAERKLQDSVDYAQVKGDQLIAHSGLDLVGGDHDGVDKLLDKCHAGCTFGVIPVKRYKFLPADCLNELCLVRVFGCVLLPLLHWSH